MKRMVRKIGEMMIKTIFAIAFGIGIVLVIDGNIFIIFYHLFLLVLSSVFCYGLAILQLGITSG
jgi:hypothetical protein